MSVRAPEKGRRQERKKHPAGVDSRTRLELMLPARFLLQNFAFFKVECVKEPPFRAPEGQVSALSHQQFKTIVPEFFEIRKMFPRSGFPWGKKQNQKKI